MAVTPVGQNRPQQPQPAQVEANPATAQKSGSGAVAYAEARAGNDVQAQFAKDAFDPNAGFQAQQANALGGTDAAGGANAAQDPDEQFTQALNSLVDALSSVVDLVKNLLPPDATGGQNAVAGPNGTGQAKDPATIAPGEPNPNADPNAAITRDQLDARGGGPGGGDPLQATGGGPARFGLGPQGPGLQGTLPGADGVAGINQNDPNQDGKNGDYKFGQTNCAPTAMAEIARGRSLQDPNFSITYKDDAGKMQTSRVADLTNEQLVTAFGRIGDTNDQGTSPNGVIDMANAAGEPVTDDEVHYDKSWKKGQPSSSFDQNWLDQKLKDGEKVIVNGAYQVKDMKGQDSLVGHYMTISGKLANGNYHAVDPWDGKVKELTGDEVRRFMEHNPYNGGVMLAIGKTQAEQQAASAPQPAAQG